MCLFHNSGIFIYRTPFYKYATNTVIWFFSHFSVQLMNPLNHCTVQFSQHSLLLLPNCSPKNRRHSPTNHKNYSFPLVLHAGTKPFHTLIYRSHESLLLNWVNYCTSPYPLVLHMSPAIFIALCKFSILLNNFTIN